MKITLHQPQCLHEQGQRENNEDNIFPAKGNDPQDGPYQLYLVCDGVGGLEKGEVASQLTCDVISDCLRGKSNITESDIDHAVLMVEQEIDTYVQENIDALGMATTLTLLSTHNKGITIAHIGDSRIYHIREGVILHKTFDHSFTNELIAKKIISEGEAVNHPKRNVVTKAIKSDGGHQPPDFKHFQDVLPEDYFFLCTDGIIETITDTDLVDILNTSNLSNQEKIETIRERCESGSMDNHSAYLLQIKDVKKEWGGRFLKELPRGNQILVYGVVAAVLVITLGVMLANLGEENYKLQEEANQEKIEQSLQILDGINIDDLELADTVSNKMEDSILMDSNISHGEEKPPDSLLNEPEANPFDLIIPTGKIDRSKYSGPAGIQTNNAQKEFTKADSLRDNEER